MAGTFDYVLVALHYGADEVSYAYDGEVFGAGFKGQPVRIGIKEGLLAHQMRTFLTMLGIIIGVSSVIAMSSFSLGSKQMAPG